MRGFSRIVVLAGAMLSVPAAAHEGGMRLDEFEKMLERVLETNPALIRTALLRAEAVEKAKLEAEIRGAAADLVTQAGLAESAMPSVGAAQAKLTIVQVVDYRCPHCAAMHPDTARFVKQTGAKISFILTSILGDESEKLARFALAADEQGKFELVHSALFIAPAAIRTDDAGLESLARRTGVDWVRAKVVMNSPEVSKRIETMRASWETLKRPGTPLTIVGSEIFEGVATFEELVASTKSKTS